jgi:hypothetical protein
MARCTLWGWLCWLLLIPMVAGSAVAANEKEPSALDGGWPAQTQANRRWVPADKLEEVYAFYRFEGIAQPEAEALLASAVAAVYLPQRGALEMLSADNLAMARQWFDLRVARESAEGHSPGDAKQSCWIERAMVEAGSRSLGGFLASTLRFAKAGDLGNDPYLVKSPFHREAGAMRSTEAAPRLPVKIGGKDSWYIYQDFEGDVWQYWSRTDNTGGQYTWGIRSCDSHWGTYSADAPRGGSAGATLGCYNNYPNGIEAYMFTEACIEAQPSWVAYLELRFKGSIAMDGEDAFGVAVEDSYGDYWGWYYWGTWSEWSTLVFNLRQWYYLGDLGANPCNTLYLAFLSDAISSSGYGARVDDLYVWYGDTTDSYECSIIADPSSGTAPLSVAFRGITDMYSPAFKWWFGDGATSQERDPVHVFSTAGDYEVALQVFDSSSTQCYSSRTIRVTQATCTYQISPTSASYTHTGGTGSVTIDASGATCSWSASSNATWVTITSGTTGTGDGTLSYSVEPKTTQGSRTGTMTIAGKTFTVSQQGPPSCTSPTITTHPASQTIVSGSTATLTVSATGTTPFTYQWYRGQSGDTSSAMAGATNAAYTTPALTITTSYWVRVSNACGQANSNTATITVTSAGAYVYWVPAVAHGAGAQGSQWRADAALLNRGMGTSTMTLTLLTDSQTLSGSASVPGGDQVLLTDLVAEVFHINGSGLLKIQATEPLTVAARVYNQSGSGTFGQGIDGLVVADTLSAGNQVYLPMLAQSSAFRTNIGFCNISGSSATVRVALFLGDGTSLGSFNVEIPSERWKQDNEPYRVRFGRTNVTNGFANVRVIAGNGVWAYASVVDNLTGDPTTIAMRR